MRQQCDFNEMYVNANIQRINLWELRNQKKRFHININSVKQT